jgi:predicted permease
MLRDLRIRVRALFRRAAVERELDDELRFHLDRQVEKHIAAGHSRAEATRRARLELGGLEPIKEDCRDARGVNVIDHLGQDLRYGLRVLRRSPGFTAIALLTLALGIGVNTALFSVVNAVLLRPLPYVDADRLVMLHQSKPNFAFGTISFLNFRDWKAQNRSFEGMAMVRSSGFSLTGSGPAEQVSALLVSSELFTLLGVQPVAGRSFAPGEDEIGAPPVALLGANLWRRRFGGSTDILGRTVILDGRGFTVVGVIPDSFDLMRSGRPRDVYVPIGQWTNNLLLDRGAGLGIKGVGRLKPGVSIEQARADMDRVTRHLATVFPEKNRGTGAALVPLDEQVVGRVRPLLLILFGAVALVLLIACVNVANLLLARSTGRARELAIRVALGAGQGRLIRQLLTESMLLALAGGALGLLVAAWGTPAALALLPDTLPRAAEVSLDGRVLLFSLLVSLASGVAFGLVPALKATEPDVHRALKDGGRGASAARHRAQDVFIVLQTAMVLVLLIGAALMGRTLASLASIDPGFDPRGVMTFGLSLPPSTAKASPDAIRARLRQTEARLAGIPGVDAVALSTGALPLLGDDEQLFWLDGRPQPASSDEMSWALWYVVGPEYRRAMGIPLLAGRFLTAEDDAGAPMAVVVDDVFARQYFGADSPIGKRIHLQDYDRPAQVVGMVGHVKQWGLASDDIQALRAQLYLSPMQLRPDTMAATTGVDVIVRSAGAPVPFETLRAALQDMDAEQVAFGSRLMEEVISDDLAGRRFSMLVFTVFAGLALLLASLGIYGVISYAVGQRTAEIGIRMALGAKRADVLGMVLTRGIKLALFGIALGLVAALAATRLMAHLLYGVSPTDPLTFAAVAAGLLAVAMTASYLPARRAARVDPMIALRHD